MNNLKTNNFWKGKKVFITGHTGFKGSWLCLLLKHLGANVKKVDCNSSETGFYEILPSEKGVNIFNNQIHGYIPHTIGNLTQLESFNAGYNQLEGEIPESIGNLFNLERLWLNYSNLSGQIPSSICNLNMLNWSDYGFEGNESYLNNNQLCPPYPDCIIENVGYQDMSNCHQTQLGDINNDGIINVQDLVLIVNIIMLNEYNQIADMNGDYVIDILDLVQLIDFILD